MSFLQNLFSSSRGNREGSPGPETAPVKMNLEERMAFRREMLFDSIKSTMQSHGILGASYRFKVVRADKRGHSFVVMVDLSTDFMDSDQGRPRSLQTFGASMAKNALARYGLGVAAVYWRVNPELKGFSPDKGDLAVVSDDASSPQAQRSANMRQYERATAEELAAFESAWQKGSELMIGERTYSSDVAPLGGADGKESR